MPAFKLALLQFRLEPHNPAHNLERALEFIDRAAAQGAQVLLLPEALPFGWMDSSSIFATEIPDGTACRVFGEAARKNNVFICTGLVEKSGDRIFNSAVLLDPHGAVLLHHRKINELEIAHPCYALGDRLGVADTPLGRFGLMICADAFVPGQSIGRTLGLMGAQVILSPCAWAVPPVHDNTVAPYGQLWRDNYGPVAREGGLWIAGCSNVGPIESGPWAGHQCIGCSMVVNPHGAVIAQGPYGSAAEEILLVDILPQPSRRPAGETPR